MNKLFFFSLTNKLKTVNRYLLIFLFQIPSENRGISIVDLFSENTFCSYRTSKVLW